MQSVLGSKKIDINQAIQTLFCNRNNHKKKIENRAENEVKQYQKAIDEMIMSTEQFDYVAMNQREREKKDEKISDRQMEKK